MDSFTGKIGRERPIRLLVVEDNDGDAGLIANYTSEQPDRLRVESYRVTTVREAIAAVESDDFDVILLDLTLPDSSGIRTFTQLHEHAPDLPVVILSGHDDEELAGLFVQKGAQDSISKDHMSGPLLRRALRHAIERKRLQEEIQSMQMQLIQSEKLESIGRLAAGVAHEVKNPLARLLVGVEYLNAVVEPKDPEVAKMLGRMERAVEQADTIVRGLLDFASNSQLGLEDRDLNQLLDSALGLLEHELRLRAITVEKTFDADLPCVKIDSGRMEQVFINVILNALHAMDQSHGQFLAIRTYAETLTDVERNESARTDRHLRSGDSVVITEIDDSGCGIPDEDLGKIFDAFYTTKPTGSGTGLGLTVVRKIIELHRGQIEFRNKLKGGTVVRIILKVSDPEEFDQPD